MRLRGFTLPEVLIAMLVGALVITGLTWLNVDYIALARRTAALGSPMAVGTHVERALDGDHRCDTPGAVFGADGQTLVALHDKGSEIVLGLTPEKGATTITAGDMSGAVARPVRAIVESAPRASGGPRPGWSIASVEAGEDTIAVVAMRCDLSEVCDYDKTTGLCREAG